jgi:serine protease inhibitor
LNWSLESKFQFRMEVRAYVRKLIVAAFVVASIATSCALVKDASANTPAPDLALPSRVSSATGDFGFRLLKALAKDPKQNTIISPLGVAMAFAMAYNGAAGGSETQSRPSYFYRARRQDCLIFYARSMKRIGRDGRASLIRIGVR